MAENDKIKAKIYTNSGIIEVEGNFETINRIIEQHTMKNTVNVSQKKPSLRLLIIGLVREGYFDDPKSFIEIKEELRRRGFLYKTSTLFPILYREFIQSGILSRTGTARSYRYFTSKEDSIQ